VPLYIFNLVDITKLPCYPHRRSTTLSLETFTLYLLYQEDYRREHLNFFGIPEATHGPEDTAEVLHVHKFFRSAEH